MGGHKTWVVFPVASAALAAPATLPHLMARPVVGFVGADAIVAVLGTSLACTLVLLVSGRLGPRTPPAWSRWSVALALSVAGPLAMEATRWDARAYLAWPAMMGGLFLVTRSSRAARWGGGLVLTAVAAALDATALVGPLGYASAAWALRRDRAYATALLTAGALGVALNVAVGRPVLTAHDFHPVAHALHRDVMVLMPFILLGIAGLARLVMEGGDDGPPAAPWAVGWCAVSLGVLLLIASGVRMNSQLAVSALACVAPYALAELAGMIGDRTPEAVVPRRVGLLAAGLTSLLTWPVARGMLHGLMLMVSRLG